jgi:hypothetical protein
VSAAAKDTIYIDAEDEITAIIEKVRASEAKIVALVLPKRAQTLQSVVNLKLLKRTASEAKKNLVLITSDHNLLPIAGAVGLHVAKTPQSKPAIPATPARKEDAENIETVTTDNDEPELDPSAAIGDLAAEETIDLDNDAEAAPAAKASGTKTKTLFNKKLKVPDFDRFRLLLFGGGALLVLLIVGSIFAFVVLPKADIHIKTDTSNVSTDLTLTAKIDAKEIDKEKSIIPAVRKELKKTENEKTPATGQKNVGEKAAGTVKIYNCNTADKLSDTIRTVPAGTVVSANGFNFILSAAVNVEPSSYTGNVCQRNKPSASTAVVAQSPGDQYNLGQRKYTVNGYPSMDADGSDMKGGTSKIVQVVSQADIDTAKQKALERVNVAATAELKAQFISENFQPLDETYGAGEPAVASTPNVNDEASEVMVTVTITYAEIGVKKEDLKTFIEESVKKNIDTSKQSIQDNGLDKAIIRLLDKPTATDVKFSIQTISVAGPQLDADGIKKEIAGKKKGATVKAIEARPGIKEVDIKYSPFWVFSTPKRTSRITITFDQGNE